MDLVNLPRRSGIWEKSMLCLLRVVGGRRSRGLRFALVVVLLTGSLLVSSGGAVSAQDSDPVLASNFGLTAPSAELRLYEPSFNNRGVAQSFTTGSKRNGYLVSEVALELRADQNSGANFTLLATQDSGICGRTEIVRDAILRKLPGVSACADVTGTHLASITGEIIMLDNGTITLQDGDFEGLSNLDVLYLHYNDLSSVPEGATGTVSVQSVSFAGTQNADIRTGLGEAQSLPAGICDRTQQVQDAILAALADISDCAAVTAEHLTTISFLYLGRKGISALQSGDFDGLSSLESLNLYGNSLSALPEDVFDGLTNLGRLNLYANSLSALPEDVFDGLTNLHSLNLWANSLSALPEDVFDGLTNLVSLELFYNGLSALPEDVFDGLTNLDRLNLSDNKLSALPEDVFDGLTNLEWLNLFGNSLSALPEDVFDGLSSLKTLELFDNGLSALPEDVFDGLTNLKTLNLYANSLSALPEDVFDGLTNLDRLSLSDNGLSALPEDVFDGLSSLEYLILFDNGLSALPEDVFDGLSSLEYLYLMNNSLSELPAGVFEGLSNLKILWMDNNSLSALPEDVFDGLTNLEWLELDDNGLSALPEDVFDGLSSLEYLELSDNSLSELPAGVFEGLSNLKKLDLSGNTGSPFTFSAELVKQGTDAVVVNVAEGAPFDMVVGLSAEGGSLSATTVTIDEGTTSSEAISVTPTGDGPAQVTISVESAVFEGVTWSRSRDEEWHQANNFKAGLGESLTAMFVAPSQTSGTPPIGGF